MGWTSMKALQLDVDLVLLSCEAALKVLTKDTDNSLVTVVP
jgi:hypothetical protein